MLRLLFLLVLALTLTACDGGDGDAAREQPAVDPMPHDRPDDPAFSDLVEGQSMVFTLTEGPLVCVRFTGPWRFESWDPDLQDWYAGDYADVTESNASPTGTLIFTWDGDYGPDAAEWTVRLRFVSETTGDVETIYVEGEREDPAVSGTFEIVEGQIDAAECQGPA